MLGQFKKYRRSSVNIISIRYDGEEIILNIARAARISENNLEEEIKHQPSHYAFLSSLHKKLLTRFEQLKVQRQRVYGQLIMKAKERTNSSGRSLSDAQADKWVRTHKRYLAASEECITARDHADQLYAAVRSFEMRAALMQTLSSNLRKER